MSCPQPVPRIDVKGAVHKRRLQSRGRRGLPKDDLSLSSINDDEGGGQKSQKIDDIFYERPQN